jgi:hypothetical protein
MAGTNGADMTNSMQVIAVGAGVTGVIIFMTTGLLWPLVPIAGAIAVIRLASQAMEEKTDKSKGAKKK